jgi:hypothetical protein
MLRNNSIGARCKLVTPKPVKTGDLLYYNQFGQLTAEPQNYAPVAVACSSMDSDGYVLMKFDDSKFLPNSIFSPSGSFFVPQIKKKSEPKPLNIEDFIVDIKEVPSIDNIDKVK